MENYTIRKALERQGFTVLPIIAESIPGGRVRIEVDEQAAEAHFTAEPVDPDAAEEAQRRAYDDGYAAGDAASEERGRRKGRDEGERVGAREALLAIHGIAAVEGLENAFYAHAEALGMHLDRQLPVGAQG